MLWQALKVQGRVIHASILRETRTRFGRSKLGYFWALFEPMAYMLTLLAIFSAMERGTPIAGVELSMFFFTAIIPWLLFSRISGAVSKAIKSNKPLLTYPQVKATDIMVALVLLEFSTLFLVAIIYLGGSFYIGDFTGIEKLLEVLLALFLATLLGFGFGLLSSTARLYWSAYNNFQSVFMRIMFFTSGKFFVAESLPGTLQEWLWYNPLLHVVEWMRSAFFNSFESGFYDLRYPVVVALLMLFLGLASERLSRHHLSQA
uniref:Transport permease protein n=1 Tax=uncultured Thiotrichaceae bacterium TaxID=298394 RepID=A0A6S6UKV7_9GAMM|nr:MAG: Capsular polysaccharide ABC transporter, permease protein KpsM [uncultured Thiotrichaceae bacterium]